MNYAFVRNRRSSYKEEQTMMVLQHRISVFLLCALLKNFAKADIELLLFYSKELL